METWDIRASLEAWKRGEADVSLFDPEGAYEDTILPDQVGETYRGLEGVARATERWIEPYEELTVVLEKVVGEGDRILRQGFTGSSFYIILEGSAVIQVDGKKRESLRPGDFFGELSILNESPRAASSFCQA